MNKYRIVEIKYYADDYVNYIIEKRKKFLWWGWWSRSYIWGGEFTPDHYSSNDLLKAKKLCSILNGTGSMYEENIIE